MIRKSVKASTRRASTPITKKALVWLTPLLAVAAFAVAPATALANYHEYCDLTLAPSGTLSLIHI